MRFYNIVITNPTDGTVIRQFTTLNALGLTNTGALNIELDIPTYAFAQPMGTAYIKIWGVAITDISQAFNLNNANIQVYAGMSKGLPLANPKQANLILQGTVTEAYGNWQDVNQSIDMKVYPLNGTINSPANIVLNWGAGTKLADAIAATLSVAYPGVKTNININPSLVLSHNAPGYYQSITQFAQYIKQISQSIIGGTYQGVDMSIRQNTIFVYDGTSSTTPKQINFADLIGQVTWIAPQTIQSRCILRGDVQVGDYVKMPPGQIGVTAQTYSQYRNASLFQGVFRVIRVRHVGNFRQPDGNSWVTIIDAIPGNL